jgi:hypothetical protein
MHASVAERPKYDATGTALANDVTGMAQLANTLTP